MATLKMPSKPKDDIDAGWEDDVEAGAKDDIDAGWDDEEDEAEEPEEPAPAGLSAEEREARVTATKERARAKAAAKKERRRAKVAAAASKQRVKQKRADDGRRALAPVKPASKVARPSAFAAPDEPDVRDVAAAGLPTRRPSLRRDWQRMAILVAIVVLVGAVALFLLRK